MLLLLPPSRTVLPDESLPPLDRFTGTLYKAIDASALTRAQRAWADERILIHDAQRGLVRADRWEAAASGLDASVADGQLVIDLRSKDYARRDPVPPGGWTVRVVSEGEDGRRLAISHWNKLHKGVFVGALVRARPRAETLPGLLRWAAGAGFRLERVADGHLDFVV